MIKKLVGVTLASLEDGADVALADRNKTIWHDENTVLAGNAETAYFDALQRYGTYSFRASPADGDSFTQEIVLASGTYTLYNLGAEGAAAGKLDWYLDAVKIVSGQDWYNAATIRNIFKSTASIAVAGGRYVFKGVVNGKHASSSNYNYYLTKSWFVRTGA